MSDTVSEWLMLPMFVLKIIMDNAMHNATTHGAERGPLVLTVDATAESKSLLICLRNNPGKFHDRALQLQSEQGQNFLFANSKQSYAEIGSKQSTFLGRHEMCEAAAVMEASIELLFVDGTDPHTTFTLTSPLVSAVAPATPNQEVLPAEALLIAADDDLIARRGYKGLIKKLQAQDSMILGETYEEAANLVQTVMDQKRAHRNVICIFDQNMEYAAGAVLGTDVTRTLREKGFKGVIVIRSANDEPAMQKLYIQAGANGHLAKHGKVVDLVAKLMHIYSRALQMGMC